MIRLITSDIDGTLLLGDSKRLDERLFPLIERYKQKGIRFCAASGRQYHSLRGLFEPVASEILFLCENGAAIYGEDRLLSKTVLPRDRAEVLARQILAREDLEVLISGADMCYLLPKSEAYVRMMRQDKGYQCTIVSDVSEIPEDILKVSACRMEGAQPLIPVFEKEWGSVFNMAIAGFEWLDFTLSDKGTGLREVCRLCGVQPEEVLSFGDNYNDVPLLDAVGLPYIMEGADPALLARFERHCRKVEDTLEELLETL